MLKQGKAEHTHDDKLLLVFISQICTQGFSWPWTITGAINVEMEIQSTSLY